MTVPRWSPAAAPGRRAGRDDCVAPGAMIESNRPPRNPHGWVVAMHDPFSWSIPFGRLFGVVIRVHWLFPFVALGVILHAAFARPAPGESPVPGFWIDTLVLVVILFVVVLFHEFGHAFMARAVEGD